MTTRREVHRVFYMIKGHCTDDQTARACYDAYFKRLWYNEEAYTHEKGFEEVWKKIDN